MCTFGKSSVIILNPILKETGGVLEIICFFVLHGKINGTVYIFIYTRFNLIVDHWLKHVWNLIEQSEYFFEMILQHSVYSHMLTDSLFSLLKVIVQCLYAFHVALWQQCVMTMCHCVFVEYVCRFRQLVDCKIYGFKTLYNNFH